MQQIIMPFEQLKQELLRSLQELAGLKVIDNSYINQLVSLIEKIHNENSHILYNYLTGNTDGTVINIPTVVKKQYPIV